MNPSTALYRTEAVIHESDTSLLMSAVRESDQRPVVLKLRRSSTPSADEVATLRREFELLRRIDSTRVAAALDFTDIGGQPALVMEARGADGTLFATLTNGPLDLAEALRIAAGIADALAEVHQSGLIHGNIRPDNVLLEGSSGVVLVDFGHAAAQRAGGLRFDPTSTLTLEPSYLAPEQTGRTNRLTDHRADLYSLGAVLYHMLTGRPPFEGATAGEVVHGHIARLAPAPDILRPSIPSVVAELVMRLLAKTPEARYHTAAGVARDLSTALEHLWHQSEIPSFELARDDVSDRFELTERLIEREPEVAELRAIFDRVSSGPSNAVLLLGAPGVGKSALARTLATAVAKRRGYFVSGKFDLTAGRRPRSGLRQAFRRLVHQLLSEPPEVLRLRRDAVRDALGDEAAVLLEFIPELEHLIGSDLPEVPALSDVEAQTRFSRLFRAFLRAITSQGTTLVVFLDDLQWADAGSLAVIRDRIRDNTIERLLLIGAARPEGDVVAQLQQALSTPQTFTLEPLSVQGIERLLHESLRLAGGTAGPLATVVHERTGGNPFFVRQFLDTLDRRNLAMFDRTERVWHVNLDAVAALDSTDNVVSLLARRIADLGPAVRAVLRVAAALGGTFRVGELERVMNHLQQDDATEWPSCNRKTLLPTLLDALDAGLLIAEGLDLDSVRPGGSAAYVDSGTEALELQFAHDRFQQAAYALLSEDECIRLHSHIGESLLNGADEPLLFEALGHLNRTLAHPRTDDDRYRLVRLNLEGAQRARTDAAFNAAVTYYDAALALLPEDALEEEHRLAFDVMAGRFRMGVVVGREEEIEDAYQSLRRHARGIRERTRIDLTMLRLLVNRADNTRALELGLKVLRSLDLDLQWQVHGSNDLDALKRRLQQTSRRVERRLSGLTVDELLALPELRDTEQSLVLSVLSEIATPAWFDHVELARVVGATMLDVSLEYGLHPASAFGLAMYAPERAEAGQIELGRVLAQAAVALADHRGDASTRARVAVLSASLNGCFFTSEALSSLLEGGAAGAAAAGDPLFQFYCRDLLLWQRLTHDTTLPEIIAEAEGLQTLSRELNLTPAQWTSRLYLRFARQLTGEDVEGEENTDVRRYAVFRGWLRLIMNRPQTAWDMMEPLRVLLSEIPGTDAQMPAYRTQLGLTAAALLADEDHPDPDGHLRETLDSSLAALETYEALNTEHRGGRLLLAAELAALESRPLDALRLYDECLDAWQAYGSLLWEALSAERAGRYHVRADRERVGRVYLAQARATYLKWGARTKVDQLDREFGVSVAVQSASTSVSGPRPSVSGIDFQAVLRAARTLSSTVVVDALLDRLLHLSIEAAGAERAALIIKTGAEWTIAGTHDELHDHDHGPAPLRSCTRVARSVVAYVRRTQSSLRLDDASDDPTFAGDEYVRQHGTRSLLCVPASTQGELVAVLYLENNIAPGAFGEGVVSTIELLAAQAAVSLRNAQLYEELREAGEHLKQSNERLAEHNRALQEDVAVDFRLHEFVGTSAPVVATLDRVQDVAPTDVAVMFRGELGTGKELLARLVHASSPRTAEPFIKVDCRRYADDGQLDELLGTAESLGRIQLAARGTLLLDEVGELSPAAQTALVQRLRDRTLEARLISTTSRDLFGAVQSGRFREELYYQLCVFPIDVPPLRARTGDIPLLVDRLLQRLAQRYGKVLDGVSGETLRRFEQYRWPGNVAELMNVLERAAITADDRVLHIDHALGDRLETGSTLGNYRLASRIGQGGMGEVWRAQHRLLRRMAAVKFISPEKVGATTDEQRAVLLKRFEREAQATAALKSPHTVSLFDYGVSESGALYYVMELLEGLDLESLVQRFGSLPPERVIPILIQVCHSLAEAHGAGLVHRDIKASNIYLTRLGVQYDMAKVLDFGLVRQVATDDDAETRITAAGTVGGTPAYIAPEMALDDTVDHRADLYALGCVGFWLLTGRLVFEADSAMKMMFLHVREPPEPPSALSEHDIPPALDALILQCLEKQPEHRPPDARTAARILRSVPLERRWDNDRAERWWHRHLPRG